MKLKVISFPKRHSRNYITKRVEGLCNLISDKYEVEKVELETYETLDEYGKYKHFKLRHCIVFEHEDKKFKIIEWDDRDNPIKYDCREIVKSPNCMYILKCQCSLRSVHPKIRPFFYFEKHNPDIFSEHLQSLRDKPITSQKLYWRGNPHLGRKEVLQHLTGIMNKEWEELTSIENYWEEIATHKVALSLPGLGAACHREFEAFAVGTPVIMPVFRNRYYEKLIPDCHYIPIKVSDGYIQRHPYEMAQKIIQVYKDVINNDHLLNNIRKNAMEYYDTYIRYDQSIHWMRNLLEL